MQVILGFNINHVKAEEGISEQGCESRKYSVENTMFSFSSETHFLCIILYDVCNMRIKIFYRIFNLIRVYIGRKFDLCLPLLYFLERYFVKYNGN